MPAPPVTDIPYRLAEIIGAFQRQHGMPEPHRLAQVVYDAVLALQAQARLAAAEAAAAAAAKAAQEAQAADLASAAQEEATAASKAAVVQQTEATVNAAERALADALNQV